MNVLGSSRSMGWLLWRQVWAVLAFSLVSFASSGAGAATVEDLVRAAGNTPDEGERLRLLRELSTHPELGSDRQTELARLLPLVENWADGKSQPMEDTARAAENGYLCRFINARTVPVPGQTDPLEPSHDSPLHPIWAMYRARMLIWRTIENSQIQRVAESRERYFGEARTRLEEAARAFPKNRVLGMYLGRRIPWPARSAPDPSAPAWANLQREGLERLAELVHWWIRERQMPDGQFGGGWGDDVEMWRWWVPVLVAFDDPEIVAGQERLSAGIFERPHLRGGFTTRLADVEHTNEDTTDSIVPMMHLKPDDPLWQQRALRLAELMRNRWTGRNQHGFLQFKSIYLSLDEVDETPRRAFDTVYHAALMQPTLLYWQRTGDRELTGLFSEWLKTWIDATTRSENGKPADILPSTVAWPSGAVGTVVEGGTSWWQPFPLDHNDALYNWPSVARLMTSTLLLAWRMSGDERHLAPMRSMADFARKHRSKEAGAVPGSDGWIAAQLDGFLPDTLAKYEFLTGDRSYHDLLGAAASGYVKFRLDGDRRTLTRELEENAEAFRYNWQAFTSEMRWTDRVIHFTSHYLRHLPEPAPPLPNPHLLYACATGDPGTPLIFPLNAVRWRTPPRDIAALVTESSGTAFRAEVFHFGGERRKVTAEFLLLQPGEYELTVTPSDVSPNDILSRVSFRVAGPRVAVPLELPSRRLMVVKVARRLETQ